MLIAQLIALASVAAAASIQSRRSGDGPAEQCASFAGELDLGNATVWFSQFITAGTNLSLPDYNATCGSPYQLVSTDVCRVALYVPTSAQSGISMEAWLPTNWTGRFLSTGNGGLGGCIAYGDLDYTTSLGFAAVATNNGHNGTSGGAFYNNPDVVEDFAYRALHTGVVVGKEISNLYYGREHTKSYYLGCSTGGRQGFKEVQSFPDDFDGVVAGAPAFAFNNLTSWSGHFYAILHQTASDAIPPISAWSAIHEDVLKQCDQIDGLKDGIIEDAMACNYQPESLICPPGINLLAPLYGENGALVYPGIQPGSEVIDAFLYYSGQSFPFTDDWFKYAIYDDPSWDPATLGPKDYAYAASKNPFDIETWHGDLSAFRSRGGKVLTYHGQQDEIISSNNSPRYYDHVAQTMSLAPAQLDEFYRFFRISGMGHCSGGPGAYHIGNQAGNSASLDPEENVLMAMVRWVEQGMAPDTITGTAYVLDTKSLGVAFKRAHCRYPYRNMYKGIGDPTVPDSWQCVSSL